MKTENNVLKAGFIGLAIAVGIGFTANTAVAALGDFPLTGANPHVAANTVIAAAFMKASTVSRAGAATSPANAPFSLNVVTLHSGTVVREFIAPSSQKVFAVSWSGPRPPNYADILGAYSERYLKPSGADLIRVGGLSQRSLSSPDLVVQSTGHMGRFSGCAYLPLEIPVGVSLSELQ
ncbi:DUF2844 domain-containing protein [Paraburkholderia sp. 2C]|jgi:uncharacterized protein DUF2844